MRDFGATRRTRDHVVFADGMAFVSEAKFAFTLEDEEHFFFAMVGVERALCLAGWKHGQVVTEVSRTDAIAYLATARRIETVLFHVVELDFIEVHDRLHRMPPLARM